ncbi:MAG: hypothetical protein RLW61_06945 [Gammaproteobacteria bacterium]
MSTKHKLNIDRSREQLKALRMVHAAAVLEQTLSAAVKQATSAAQLPRPVAAFRARQA